MAQATRGKREEEMGNILEKVDNMETGVYCRNRGDPMMMECKLSIRA